MTKQWKEQTPKKCKERFSWLAVEVDNEGWARLGWAGLGMVVVADKARDGSKAGRYFGFLFFFFLENLKEGSSVFCLIKI